MATINQAEAESILILSIRNLSLIKSFKAYSRATLYVKLHQIREFAGKTPSTGFIQSPISLWDVALFLRTDVNRLVDEKILKELQK